MNKIIAAAGIFLIASVFMSGCEKKTDKIVLKLGHVLEVTHPVHIGMEYMAKLVNERTGGKVVIEIYPSGQLGNERTMIEQVKMGMLDMVKTSTAPMEGFEKKFGVFSLPYIFRDRDHYWRVLDGPIGKEMLLSAQDIGFRGLCYYDAGSRSFYTKDKMIEKPEDLAGMKIRVMKSPAFMDMISVMGGSPTPIGWGELYTALQQGTVDGAENNPPSFYTSRHYEVCKYYSLDEHSMPPDILLINTGVWNKLPDDVKKILQEAAQESSVFERKLWAEKTAEALEAVKKDGVQVITPDKAPFIEKVQPMFKQYEGTEIGDLLRRIRETE